VKSKKEERMRENEQAAALVGHTLLPSTAPHFAGGCDPQHRHD